MKIIILILLIVFVYLVMKYLTVHRCPHCHSRYILRYKEFETDKNYKVFKCIACGKKTEVKKFFSK